MPKKSKPDAIPVEERRVLTVAEFRARNRISKTTWYRLRDQMPPTIRLSTAREGVRLSDEFEWQEARRRAQASE
jgi:hypothetical protein